MRKPVIAAAAALSTIAFFGSPAPAQESGPYLTRTFIIEGHVPPIARYDYAQISETSGILNIEICNVPGCAVVVELAEPTEQTVTVSFNGGLPMEVSHTGRTTVYRSDGGMLNESYLMSVQGGRINIDLAYGPAS